VGARRTSAPWRLYSDRRIIFVFLLGIASGLPLLLVMSTLMVRLGVQNIDRGLIGLLALAQLPYSLKFLWAPLFDRVRPPLPLGRRRGWGIAVQLCLAGAILLLGLLDPVTQLPAVAAAALLVAFLSASQDVVIDGYRVDLLDPLQQGPGGGAALMGYRLGMLAGGGGALALGQWAGWTLSYAAMAALAASFAGIFLLAPVPAGATLTGPDRAGPEGGWLAQAVLMPLGDLVPAWMEALPKMKVGDEWMLYVPPQLGYGERGAGPIPPNSVLVFRVKLLGMLAAD